MIRNLVKLFIWLLIKHHRKNPKPNHAKTHYIINGARHFLTPWCNWLQLHAPRAGTLGFRLFAQNPKKAPLYNLPLIESYKQPKLVNRTPLSNRTRLTPLKYCAPLLVLIANGESFHGTRAHFALFLWKYSKGSRSLLIQIESTLRRPPFKNCLGFLFAYSMRWKPYNAFAFNLCA